MNKKKFWDKYSYFIVYSIVFTILIIGAYAPFWSHGRSLIRYSDGLEQFYYSVRYLAEYIKTFFNTIFEQGKIELPMWDMSIGYGSDILTTLHIYAIGDPLNLLAALVNKENLEYLFCFLILFRMYLSGIFFSMYSFFMGNGRKATLLGALVYSLCGWGLITGMKYASFGNPLMYFPLLLLGIEKVYQKRKSVLFTIMIAISAISYFYFFYMFCIFIFIYALFRYFDYGYQLRWKEILLWVKEFIVRFLIGICISAIVLLPMFIVLLSQQRLGITHDISALYNPAYYMAMPGALVTFSSLYHDEANWGYAAIVLPSIIVIFLRKNHYKTLKKFLIITTIFLCIPYVGHVMNGFSYVANRWLWAYSMVAGYAVVKAVPAFRELKKIEKGILFLTGILYIPFWFFIFGTYTNPLGVLVLTIGIIIITGAHKIGYYAILAGTSASILVNAYSVFQQETTIEGYVNNMAVGNVDNTIKSFPHNIVLETQDYINYRYDQYNLDTMEAINSDIVMGTNSVRFQYSIGDESVAEFNDKLYLNNFCSFHYNNLDGRNILETLASVKYYLVKNEDSQYVPYYYRNNELEVQNGHALYESDFPLPIGYMYDAYIDREAWEKMSVIQKQYSFLQGAVTDDSTLSEAELKFSDLDLEYDIIENNGVEFEGNTVKVLQEKGSITLETEQTKDGEVYVIFEGLSYTGKSNTANITLDSGTVKKDVIHATPQNNQSTGKENYLCNLGYQESQKTEITISFEQPGNYGWNQLQIVLQPLDEMPEYIGNLSNNTLKNIVFESNKISGTVETEKMLCLTIPYREGWELYLDGRQVPLKKVNIMFMGVEIPEGKHTVQLVYRTPGILAGSIITLMGCVIFVIYYNNERKKK